MNQFDLGSGVDDFFLSMTAPTTPNNSHPSTLSMGGPGMQPNLSGAPGSPNAYTLATGSAAQPIPSTQPLSPSNGTAGTSTKSSTGAAATPLDLSACSVQAKCDELKELIEHKDKEIYANRRRIEQLLQLQNPIDGQWTDEQHFRFLEAYRRAQRGETIELNKLALYVNHTVEEIRAHAQKYAQQEALRRQQTPNWTLFDDKIFENGLEIYGPEVPDRWLQIAALLSNKTEIDVANRYRDLMEDIAKIESGEIPIPQYRTPDGLSSPEDPSKMTSPTGPQRRDSKREETRKGVPWTEDEHRRFLIGLQRCGKGDWRNISRNYVKSRTPAQVASHAQKYFLRQAATKTERRRSSIHDITTPLVSEEEVIARNLEAAASASSGTSDIAMMQQLIGITPSDTPATTTSTTTTSLTSLTAATTQAGRPPNTVGIHSPYAQPEMSISSGPTAHPLGIANIPPGSIAAEAAMLLAQRSRLQQQGMQQYQQMAMGGAFSRDLSGFMGAAGMQHLHTAGGTSMMGMPPGAVQMGAMPIGSPAQPNTSGGTVRTPGTQTDGTTG